MDEQTTVIIGQLSTLPIKQQKQLAHALLDNVMLYQIRIDKIQLPDVINQRMQ